MSNIFIYLLILIVAITMTMVGKGGGNFYVVILALANISMYEAATTGQFILFSASIAAMIIFNKNKSIVWPLAILIGSLAAVSALGGGLFSHYFSVALLKLIFSVMLVLSGAVMLYPVKERGSKVNNFGTIVLKSAGTEYKINLLLVIPVTLLTGFASGLVGVSGGSFIVPLIVLACGVPMQVAVGTSATLIATTSFMGFIGHAIQGDFNPSFAIPLGLITIIGGIIGGKFALKSRPKNLKKLFAYTNWLAAVIMLIDLFR